MSQAEPDQRAARRAACRAADGASGPATLAERFRSVRATTEALCEPLAVEDFVVQSMPDASPTKWHLAHTTWFFETFVLAGRPGYRPRDPAYAHLFNSYYQSVGDPYPRPDRGLLSRPTVAEVFAYRRHVDEAMEGLLADGAEPGSGPEERIELGLHHEQQHQELLLTDVKHVFGRNPLRPAYRAAPPPPRRPAPPLRWVAHAGGVRWIGHDGRGFAFDNERPRHRELVPAFEIASRPVSAGEYLEFVEAGGYQRPGHWLSDGWAGVRQRGQEAPLYWERRDGEWWHLTLTGMRALDPGEPVCHVSFYEADAYARFAGCRLPTEQEWEVAAGEAPVEGNLLESGRWHPVTAREGGLGLQQLFGDVWEWTRSPYDPYPRYAPPAGALGEYNGKFMCNQFVLRGGSCATPGSHIRPSYRNFFPPDARWQFSGFRLARDA